MGFAKSFGLAWVYNLGPLSLWNSGFEPLKASKTAGEEVRAGLRAMRLAFNLMGGWEDPPVQRGHRGAQGSSVVDNESSHSRKMLDAGSLGDFLLQETGKRVAITRDCYSDCNTFPLQLEDGRSELRESPITRHPVQSTHSALDCSGLPRPARSSARSSIKKALPPAGEPCARAARRQGPARRCSEVVAAGCCAG